MSSLFNLTGQYLALAHQLADGDFDADTIADTIEASGIVDSITDKAQAIEYVARGAEAHNAVIDVEIDRLKALKARRIKTAQGLRDYIKTSMEAMSIDRIECPLFAISTDPKPPVAAPDKKAIAADIKAGIEVTGARLVQGTRLAIA